MSREYTDLLSHYSRKKKYIETTSEQDNFGEE